MKQTKTLEKEILELRRENTLLKKLVNINDTGESVEDIINEYQSAIAEAKAIKEKYNKAIEEANVLKKKYKQDMDSLLAQMRKQIK